MLPQTQGYFSRLGTSKHECVCLWCNIMNKKVNNFSIKDSVYFFLFSYYFCMWHPVSFFFSAALFVTERAKRRRSETRYVAVFISIPTICQMDRRFFCFCFLLCRAIAACCNYVLGFVFFDIVFLYFIHSGSLQFCHISTGFFTWFVILLNYSFIHLCSCSFIHLIFSFFSFFLDIFL